ncbi:hypothetical protein GIB67_042870 [Kingdonia uniflora]|uniref:Pentatricopeptide repeat-containing protein n=1 Tax=Kingdonia uniflora TaxID=39325 RepID=A0A7J7P5V6_9MAGN|nr:hypothetical protein GIB67_042870 [Kingdonia uniflora]
MERDEVSPDEQTYIHLIDVILASYRDRGDWQKSFLVMKEMRNSGATPDRHFYNVMIDTFWKYNCLEHAMATFHSFWEQTVNAFKVMRADGLKPSVLVLNSLINAFGEDRGDAEAFALLEYMKENDLKPDVAGYTTLMKALIRCEKFDKVPAVNEEMI